MNWIKVIQSGIAYIEDELGNKQLSPDLVARHVHVSESHFSRAFNILTGYSVSIYIRNRRLSVAGDYFKQTHLSVLDVALHVGYESPEAFSKAFKRFHGVNPSESKDSELVEFYPLHVELVLTQERPLSYRIVEKEAIYLSGQTRIVSSDDSTLTALLWRESMENGYINQCVNDEGFETLVGVSTTEGYTIKAKCKQLSESTHMIIPAHKWVVFDCYGKIPESILKTWGQIYTKWMQKEEYKISDLPQLEVYYQSEDGFSCEIWIAIN